MSSHQRFSEFPRVKRRAMFRGCGSLGAISFMARKADANSSLCHVSRVNISGEGIEVVNHEKN